MSLLAVTFTVPLFHLTPISPCAPDSELQLLDLLINLVAGGHVDSATLSLTLNADLSVECASNSKSQFDFPNIVNIYYLSFFTVDS